METNMMLQRESEYIRLEPAIPVIKYAYDGSLNPKYVRVRYDCQQPQDKFLEKPSSYLKMILPGKSMWQVTMLHEQADEYAMRLVFGEDFEEVPFVSKQAGKLLKSGFAGGGQIKYPTTAGYQYTHKGVQELKPKMNHVHWDLGSKYDQESIYDMLASDMKAVNAFIETEEPF